jgi:GNAT superfamily N-acetyltransferase
MRDLVCARAVVDDLGAIVALLADDVFGAQRNPPFDMMADAYTGAFAAFDEDNHVVVGRLEGRIVACYQITFIRGLSHGGALRAQIESVRVASMFRGQGLGSRLMEDALARAQARNCRLVQLTTDQRRPDTRRFYERLGFAASHHGMKRML